MGFYLNRKARARVAPDDAAGRILDEAGALEARREITSWPDYQGATDPEIYRRLNEGEAENA